MGSLFDDAMQAADGGPITEIMGEPITVHPRVRGAPNRPPAADVLRSPATADGLFLQKGTEQRLYNFRNALNVPMTDTFEAHVWFAADAIVELGFEPDKDDLIIVQGRHYSVSSTDKSDVGDVLLNLVLEDR